MAEEPLRPAEPENTPPRLPRVLFPSYSLTTEPGTGCGPAPHCGARGTCVLP